MNPFANDAYPLALRVACSNAALEHAKASVLYQIARNALVKAREETGGYPPAIHQAATLAGVEMKEAAFALDAAVKALAEYKAPTEAAPPPSKNPADYKAIRLWGRDLGSYDYYIVGQQNRAVRMAAPTDALYERDGKWTCVRDLAPDHQFRAAFAKL